MLRAIDHRPLTTVLAIVLLSGLPSSVLATYAPGFLLDLPADGEANEAFGRTVVHGDLDGDGYDDLAVGNPYSGAGGRDHAGTVWIAFGGPGGLRTAPLLPLTQEDAAPGTECGLSETNDSFGQALATGDFDGDGRDDLAVGIPDEDTAEWSNLGAVAVFFGQADRSLVPGPCLLHGTGGLPGDAMDDVRFGHSLAVGDFDSDGRGDLAVGAIGTTLGDQFAAGSVTVISGGDGPLDPTTATYWHQDRPDLPGAAEPYDGFGWSLATGDLVLGLDVPCDLVIGAPGDRLESPGEPIPRGSVHVLFGCTETGLATESTWRWTQSSFPLFSSPEQRFGEAVAVGNYDCVGAEDLAIGAPDWPGAGGKGAISVVYGDQTDLPSVVVDAVTLEDLGGPLLSADRLGRALTDAPASMGCDDFVAGAPGNTLSPRRGAIFAFEARFGIGITPGFHEAFELADADSNETLGRSLTAGRFDGETTSIVAGAPDRDPVAGDNNDGAVWVLLRAELLADGFESGDTSAWSGL